MCGRPSDGSNDAFDKMILKRARDILADRPADDRLARTVHRVRVAADEIMPVVQGFALGAQAIGAGLRQPFEVVDLRFGQRQAIGNMAAAMLVVAAARGRKIEQAARSEEHTSELQSLMRISYAVFCLKK